MSAEFSANAPALNPEQQQAANLLWQSTIPALQVVAGAGSGKTSTLVAAVASAQRGGLDPEKMAVISFTRKAAHEVANRLAQYSIRPGFCGTIHALAWKLLRQAEPVPRLVPHTSAQRAELARRLFPGNAHVPERLLLKHGFFTISQQLQLESEWLRQQELAGECDLDSLVPFAARLSTIAQRYAVIFVDEFQDTSPDQVALLKTLAPHKLFAVGDDWQSIYRFRGADVTLSRRFTSHFPGAARLFLLRNYRSCREIVALGNRAIKLSREYVPKKLKPAHGKSDRPVCFLAHAPQPAEAWQKFLAYLAHSNRLPEKTVVLVRTNAHKRLVESALPPSWQVLTIHKSKGLEFDSVVVFGIGEHTMPHRDNDFDEEVRILYVALTRARRQLAFIAWEHREHRSAFLPFLLQHCRLKYL